MPEGRILIPAQIHINNLTISFQTDPLTYERIQENVLPTPRPGYELGSLMSLDSEGRSSSTMTSDSSGRTSCVSMMSSTSHKPGVTSSCYNTSQDDDDVAGQLDITLDRLLKRFSREADEDKQVYATTLQAIQEIKKNSVYYRPKRKRQTVAKSSIAEER